MISAEKSPPQPHYRRFGLSFDANHLPPHGISFPHHMLPEMKPQLSPGQCDIPFCHEIGIPFFNLANISIQMLHRRLPEGICGRHMSFEIGVAEVAVHNLIIFFQGLGKASLVQLNEGFEFT